jgi:hypothetical protein
MSKIQKNKDNLLRFIKSIALLIIPEALFFIFKYIINLTAGDFTLLVVGIFKK